MLLLLLLWGCFEGVALQKKIVRSYRETYIYGGIDTGVCLSEAARRKIRKKKLNFFFFFYTHNTGYKLGCYNGYYDITFCAVTGTSSVCFLCVYVRRKTLFNSFSTG